MPFEVILNGVRLQGSAPSRDRTDIDLPRSQDVGEMRFPGPCWTRAAAVQVDRRQSRLRKRVNRDVRLGQEAQAGNAGRRWKDTPQRLGHWSEAEVLDETREQLLQRRARSERRRI